MQWVREGAGARLDDLDINITAFILMITDDARGAAEGIAGELGITPQQVLDLPFALIGTVDQMADTLVERTAVRHQLHHDPDANGPGWLQAPCAPRRPTRRHVTIGRHLPADHITVFVSRYSSSPASPYSRRAR